MLKKSKLRNKALTVFNSLFLNLKKKKKTKNRKLYIWFCNKLTQTKKLKDFPVSLFQNSIFQHQLLTHK